MDASQGRDQPEADASARRFNEQSMPGETGQCDGTTLSHQGVLEVSGDENAGGDPYNHTGRFKRNVR